MKFDEHQQLLFAILESLTELTANTLNQVFEECMRLLQPYINANDDYLE
jgi:hypothetical protein